MNRTTVVLIPLALLALMTSCQKDLTANKSNSNATPTVASTPDEFAAARVSYEKNCKVCHGANGEGGPVKLEDGTKLKVPSLREGHALKHEDVEFAKQISLGGDGMPGFGEKLRREEMNDLIKLIRRDFQAGQTPPAK